MRKRILLLLVLPLFALSSCGDWLDVVPESDIATIESEFETYAEAEDWLRTCYAFLQYPYAQYNNIAYWATDEMVADNYLRNLTGASRRDGLDIIAGRQNVFTPYDDVWYDKTFSQDPDSYRQDYYTAIVLCNHFIAHIDQVYNLSDRDKKEWKAEVKALKAFFYFELMRRYGPVVIVPEDMDPNQDVEDLKYPRSHVDTCFNYIVRLCDEAAADLPFLNEKQSERRGYFNKEAALALKARTLLYAASPLFNGNRDYADFRNKNGEPLFNSTEDPEKWRRAAEAADSVIAITSARLVEGNTANTPLQATMLDIEKSVLTNNFVNDEALWMIKVQTFQNGFPYYTLPDYDDGSNHSLQGGCFVPTMKMVEMFYTENGLPIDQDLNWVGSGNYYALSEENDPKYTDVVVQGEPVLNLHRRREPRFYADIAADGCYWRLGSAIENNYLVRTYQGEDFGLGENRLNSLVPQNITGYWLKKWCSSSSTLAAHEGDLTTLGTKTYPIFRLAEMYLISAEAWNEYEGPSQKVYDKLNVVRKRAGIPDVEDAWRNAREPNKINTKEGMRDIIRQEWNIEFAFEGTRFWNVRRWKTANIELSERVFGWNVVGDDANSFFNNGQGPVIVYSGNRFVAPRDYLYPIRSEEVQRSGFVQNPGW